MAKKKSLKKEMFEDMESDEIEIPEIRKAKRAVRSESSDRSDSGIYRVTEVIGTSTKSWEDASKNAIEVAGKTLRDLRIAEVSKLDIKVENGKVVAYRARIMLSFKYQA